MNSGIIKHPGSPIEVVLKALGPPGFSAYEIWLRHGNTGTEQDFLDSLKAQEARTVNFDDVEVVFEATNVQVAIEMLDQRITENSITISQSPPNDGWWYERIIL